MVDSREGLTYNDVALYKWLHYHKMRLPHEQHEVASTLPIDPSMTEEERYQMILKEEEKYHKKRRDLQLGNVQLPPSEDADMEQREQFEFDKKSFLTDKRSQEFRNQFRHNDDMFLGENVKIPEIIYLANKSENGYEGDLLSDYYSMFPNAGKEKDKDGILLEPIFISAEHGDGLPDLMQALRKRIPNS